jgi:hypothetical protein
MRFGLEHKKGAAQPASSTLVIFGRVPQPDPLAQYWRVKIELNALKRLYTQPLPSLMILNLIAASDMPTEA